MQLSVPIPALANDQDKVTVTLFARIEGQTTISYKLGEDALEQSLSSSDDTGQAKVTIDLLRDGADIVCMVDQSTGGPAYQSTPSGPLAECRIPYTAQTSFGIETSGSVAYVKAFGPSVSN